MDGCGERGMLRMGEFVLYDVILDVMHGWKGKVLYYIEVQDWTGYSEVELG